jgi:hypothetical protein
MDLGIALSPIRNLEQGLRKEMTDDKKANPNKDSPNKSISEEILNNRDKMVNLQPSKFIAMYWGYDLSPPHLIYLNYSSK